MSDLTQSRKAGRRATSESAPPAPLPLLGGRFDLLAELGSGSSGTVYRARLREARGELPAGSEVAVKFLRQDRMDDNRALERLLQEGQLGQQVRNPNVAAIHGAETIEVLGMSVTYLVMELVQGTTLRAFLQQQGPPVEDLVRRIGADAAGGLHALHRHGVVHRDVKPDNLVLTPDGRVKVVDLGLARPFGVIGGGSSPSGQAGSVSYTAPEVLQGRPAQPRSDLYSLGIVLYEVATGRHPFADRTTADEMLHAHVFEAPPRPSHLRPRISPMLEQLLLELLAKEPEQRPKDAETVARILTQGERGEWWRRNEERAPALASERRLRRMRRWADVPLFGRQQEQARLDEFLRRAREGTGACVLVAGPGGIGKRRLLDECMARWLREYTELLYLGGETDPGRGQGEPFAATLLDHLLRGDSRDSPSARQRLQHRARAELQFSEPDAASLAATVLGQSQESSEARAELLSRALLLLAKPGRTLVVRVDRAERLDTTGRLVLQRLQTEAPGHALLLLLAAAPDTAILGATERIELGGLDEADFLAFGQALFRGGEVAQELLHAAHVVLSGSPGNLIEALEHMVQSDELQGRLGDYHDLREGAGLRPAPGHLQRFENRVATLPMMHRRVLEAAAVLGDRFPLRDLATLVAVPELQVLETLSLFRGRILRALGGEVAFRHRDFRGALLHGIAEEARRDLHRRAAAILQARSAPPLEIGMHLSWALEHEACLEPLLQALAALTAAGSRRTSLRVAARLRVHFQHAPPGRATDERRLRWLLLHAEARRNAQQPELAAQLWQQARELAQQLELVRQQGEALYGIAATAMDQGRLPQALVWLEQAHGCLDDGSPEAAAKSARAHGLHARVLLYLGQSAEGMRQLQTALRTAPAEQAELRIDLHIDLARLEALRHHYPTALKTLRKVEQELQDRHLPRMRMRHLLYRGQCRAVLDDDAAVLDLRSAAEDAQRLSLPAYAGRAHLYLAERAFRRSRDDEARAELARALELARGAGDRLGETLATIHLYRLGGDGTGLEETVAELALPSLRAAWLVAKGARAAEASDRAAAEADAEAALAVMANADLALPLKVRILHLAGRQATARTLVRGIAERFPERDTRRRFLAVWERNVRI